MYRLACPHCGEAVSPDEVDFQDDSGVCPCCAESSPDAEWIEAEPEEGI